MLELADLKGFGVVLTGVYDRASGMLISMLAMVRTERIRSCSASRVGLM